MPLVRKCLEYWKGGWPLLFAVLLGVFFNRMGLEMIKGSVPPHLQYHVALVAFLIFNPIYANLARLTLFSKGPSKDSNLSE